jgi:hypothetical protein
MPLTHDEVRRLERRREELRIQLAQVGDMRPGSLVGRFRRCGKPDCHCAREATPGHGPCWSLTRRVGGKTVTKIIPAGRAVDRTREQIAEYRRFRDLAHELVEVSARLCSARIETPVAASQEGAKKGGSKRHSRSRSAARSKRS